MRIVITGASGLVGRALREHCVARDDEVFAYRREDLDITNADLVERCILQQTPDAVLNCAAWTDVDGCETNPKKAYAVNALGPQNLARASRRIGAAFVTISTDYVFDGAKNQPYTENDSPNPLSVYGKAKLDGEQRTQSEYDRAVIVRTGFIFGVGGKNFLSRVVELARDNRPVFAISDAKGTPTYARDLASRLRELAVMHVFGVFHVVNAGEGATYEQFARAALKFAGLDDAILNVVSNQSLNRPAPRPADSRLDCLSSKTIGLAELPPWEDGLRRFIAESMAKAPARLSRV